MYTYTNTNSYYYNTTRLFSGPQALLSAVYVEPAMLFGHCSRTNGTPNLPTNIIPTNIA